MGHSIEVEGSHVRHDNSGSVESGNKPLKWFEQIQLRKSQMIGDQLEGSDQTASSRGSGSSKTKVLRQDSGLGTLSTISHKL